MQKSLGVWKILAAPLLATIAQRGFLEKAWARVGSSISLIEAMYDHSSVGRSHIQMHGQHNTMLSNASDCSVGSERGLC